MARTLAPLVALAALVAVAWLLLRGEGAGPGALTDSQQAAGPARAAAEADRPSTSSLALPSPVDRDGVAPRDPAAVPSVPAAVTAQPGVLITVEEETGRPIAAQVSCSREAADGASATLGYTGEDGRLAFDQMSVDALLDGPRYVSAWVYEQRYSAEPTPFDPVRFQREGLVLRLTTGARCAVRVVDGEGAPIPFARVSVQAEDWSRAMTRLAGLNGVAEFSALPAEAPHSVEVAAHGYDLESVSPLVTGSIGATVTVEARMAENDERVVHVRATFPADDRPERAHVNVHWASGRWLTPDDETRSLAYGATRLRLSEHFPPGPAVLRLHAPGFTAEGVEVELPAKGAVTAEFVVRSAPVTQRYGLVVDDDSGEPVSGAVVYLRDPNRQKHEPCGYSGWRLEADAEGRFELKEFQRGYEVAAFVEGRGNSGWSVVPELPQQCIVRLARENALEVRVTGAEGAPVAGVAVQLRYRGEPKQYFGGSRLPDPEWLVLETHATDAEGRVTFSALLPNEVLWPVVKDTALDAPADRRWALDSSPDALLAAGRAVRFASTGQRSRIDLTTVRAPMAKVRLRVRLAEGVEPVSMLRLRRTWVRRLALPAGAAEEPSGGVLQEESRFAEGEPSFAVRDGALEVERTIDLALLLDADGAAERTLEVPAGRYRFVVDRGRLHGDSGWVDVQAGAPAGIELVARRSAQVIVQLVDQAGRPFAPPETQVNLSSAGWNRLERPVLDGNGRADVTAVLPDLTPEAGEKPDATLAIRVQSPHLHSDPNVPFTLPLSELRARIAAAGSGQPVVLRVPVASAQWVAVRVVDREGAPVPHVRLRASPGDRFLGADTCETDGEGWALFRYRAQSDGDDVGVQIEHARWRGGSGITAKYAWQVNHKHPRSQELRTLALQEDSARYVATIRELAGDKAAKELWRTIRADRLRTFRVRLMFDGQTPVADAPIGLQYMGSRSGTTVRLETNGEGEAEVTLPDDVRTTSVHPRSWVGSAAQFFGVEFDPPAHGELVTLSVSRVRRLAFDVVWDDSTPAVQRTAQLAVSVLDGAGGRLRALKAWKGEDGRYGLTLPRHALRLEWRTADGVFGADVDLPEAAADATKSSVVRMSQLGEAVTLTIRFVDGGGAPLSFEQCSVWGWRKGAGGKWVATLSWSSGATADGRVVLRLPAGEYSFAGRAWREKQSTDFTAGETIRVTEDREVTLRPRK